MVLLAYKINLNVHVFAVWFCWHTKTTIMHISSSDAQQKIFRIPAMVYAFNQKNFGNTFMLSRDAKFLCVLKREI